MDTFKVYRDKADPPEFRWRQQAANGEEVANSGEGYTRTSDALEAAVREADEGDIIEVIDPDTGAASTYEIVDGVAVHHDA